MLIRLLMKFKLKILINPTQHQKQRLTIYPVEEDDPFSKNNYGILETVVYALLNTLVSEAHAAEADLNADSPQVRQLKNSMRARYNGLKQFYAKGWVGLQNDGLIVVRNPGDIALAMRSQVKQLVAAENNDRRALYQAIAVANGHTRMGTADSTNICTSLDSKGTIKLVV